MIDYVITNKHGLAQEVYDAIVRNHYKGHVPGAFSSGSKISDPNFKHALTKKLQEDSKTYVVEFDAIDQFRRWQGNALHMSIEAENRRQPDVICEETFTCEVNGEIISGTIDRYSKLSFILKDYKSCPVYKWQRKDFEEWEAQANIYAYQLRMAGHSVNKILIQVIMYDWSPSEARHKPDYPQNPLPVIEIDMWHDEKVYQYIAQKIEEKKTFYAQLDFDLVESGCTPKERWADPTVFKVYKNQQKSAMRGGSKFKTYEEAEQFMRDAQAKALEKPKTAGDKFRIDEKKGNEWKRCSNWCGVSSFCKFYQEHLASLSEEEKEKEVDAA